MALSQLREKPLDITQCHVQLTELTPAHITFFFLQISQRIFGGSKINESIN